MLKHFVDQHEGEDFSKRRFAVKVLSYTRSSFERQILESVKLQNNRHHNLLNSKAEYNRCAIPRLSSKLGEKEFKKYTEEEKEEKKRGEILEMKIRKEQNKDRRDDQREGEEIEISQKRRKVEVSSKSREEKWDFSEWAQAELSVRGFIEMNFRKLKPVASPDGDNEEHPPLPSQSTHPTTYIDNRGEHPPPPPPLYPPNQQH